MTNLIYLKILYTGPSFIYTTKILNIVSIPNYHYFIIISESVNLGDSIKPPEL